jgi:hypothetical protein
MGKVKKSKTSKKFWELSKSSRNGSGSIGNWCQIPKDKLNSFDIDNLLDKDKINEEIRAIELNDGEYIKVNFEISINVRNIEHDKN